ncbi:DEAD/DEAH box helicase [Oceaniserpentilla sp. 4NH20-0058]|uniref:DEAD/DEAH box helicase n=1 Tax=Oceaniserpentilla sp. 4NH20-0058 TaxID=3127660 RepID=UPI003109F655
MSFDSLGLSPKILQALNEKGYSSPSPIQSQAIPAVLSGKDIMAAAQTGTGKTAGFTLPILQRLLGGNKSKGNQVRSLILTPTRELAQQVADNVATYSQYLPLKSTVVYGGVKINPQMMRLRGGVDVLVATPGRLLDLHAQNAVKFDRLEVLVLDEADRMLDMGFIHDLKKIMKLLPKDRQNLLFSATFSGAIKELAKTIVHQPIEISVSPANSTAKTVKQWIYPSDRKAKSPLLSYLIKTNDWQQVLVFSRTKHGANKLTKFLESEDISAAAIHGNKSQGARTRALEDFKGGKVRVLVATDIAARGIDIDQLPQVVNFDLPNVAEDYVHRIGRTGRAGATGQAVSLVSHDEFKELSAIERLIGRVLDREYIIGYEPVNTLPDSRLDTRPIKNKKPKKPHEDGQRSGDAKRGHKPPSKNKQHVTTGGNNKPSSKAKKTSQGGNTGKPQARRRQPLNVPK